MVSIVKMRTVAEHSSRLRELLRNKEGVVLDKDGVLIDNSRLVYANLKRGFRLVEEPFRFERRLVWGLNGLDRNFTGTKPIMALLSINDLSKNRNYGDPNALLGQILSKTNASSILTEIINTHTSKDDKAKAEKIYWHDGGSFFNSEEGTGYLRQCFRASEALGRLLEFYHGKVAILTNAPRRSSVERNLSKTGLGEVTDRILILTGEDVSKTKPDPEGLYKISRKLGIIIPSLFFVGDSVTDIDAAKRCGMDSVAISGGAGFQIHLKNAQPSAMAANLISLAEATEAQKS